MLVLDDLQWADRDTVDLLAPLAWTTPLLCISRPGSAAADTLLAIGDLEVVTVGPLDAEAADAVLRRRAPHLDAVRRAEIVRQADGHPLSLELLASRASTDPPAAATDRTVSLRALVAELTEPERTALVRAAWGIDGDVDQQPLAALDARGITVVDEHGNRRVAASVLGDLALDTLPASEQQALHEAAARRATDPARAVDHWLAAGRTDEAHTAALAAQAGAGRVAAAELAAVAARTAPAAERMTHLTHAVQQLLRIDRFDDAWALVTDLVPDPEALPTGEWLGVQAMRGALLVRRGDLDGADEVFEGTRARDRHDHPQEEYHLLTLHAGVLASRFDITGAREACGTALQLAADHGLRPTRAVAMEALLRGVQAPDPGLGDIADRLLADATDDPEPHIAFELAVQLLHAALLGDTRRASQSARVTRLQDRMRSTATALGHRGWLLEVDAIEAFHASFRDLGSADSRHRLRALLDDPGQGEVRTHLAAVLAVAEADHGDLRTATDLVARARARDVSGRVRPLGWADLEIAWLAGHDLTTEADPLTAADLVDPTPACGAVARRWLALEHGRPVGDEPWPMVMFPALTGLPIEAEAVELMAGGDQARAAADRFLEAADRHDLYLGRNALRCRWAAGECLARAGEPVAAEALLVDVAATCTDRGLLPMLGRVNASLRALGRRTDTGARPAPSPLTPRQVEVLALVADGLSTKEISARLRVSTRTVDAHVDNAVRRLGVAGRREAALIVREQLLARS